MNESRRCSSDQLFARACDVLPGGVSSPVRAFGAVGGRPRFIASGLGSKIRDVDGREYVDLVMSWGPILHGHAHPRILAAVESAARRGTSFGAPTLVELELAEGIRRAMPSLSMLRFVSSGTEATMSALRLARAYTGRETIVKFDGCYHGHVDSLLVEAGSGALTHGEPTSAGISRDAIEETRGLRYNDSQAVLEFMRQEGERVAAIIVEPVAGNMGTVGPEPTFLRTLREVTAASGSLLIFDEVITGFRVGLGGAQQRFGIVPDLTCLGKIIGGGLPAAAFGGRAEVMQLVSPLGPVYQAGTLSGNPVAMGAGLASLEMAAERDYAYLEDLAIAVQEGLTSAGAESGIDLCVNRESSMLSCFFTREHVHDLDSARTGDAGRYSGFFHAMLDQGVYLPPSQFETWMLSFAHTSQDVDCVLGAASAAFERLAASSGL